MTNQNETQSTESQPRAKVLFLIIPIALALVFLVLTRGLVGASPTADCSSGNVPLVIETDTELSGELYVTSDVTVRDGATLTLTAGTNVNMCGEYDFRITDAQFMALGSQSQPIVFDAVDAATNWGSIHYIANGNTLMISTLQYVELNNGGGNDPIAETGALHILGSWDGSIGSYPVVDHLTIQDSGAYGAYVRVDEDDPTPMSMSNLTINRSAHAPIKIFASAVGGLGSGNSFSNNADEVIEVWVGTVLGGGLRHDQTWRKQPIPYKVTSTADKEHLSIGGNEYPVLTTESRSPREEHRLERPYALLTHGDASATRIDQEHMF